MTTSPPLLERGAELEMVDRAILSAGQGGGGLVVIDGVAGMGKTALLEAARATAVEAGLVTLRARGAELERAFGFGVIRQLFDGVIHYGMGNTEALFGGAARFAAPLLDVEIDGAPVAPSDNPFTARHALYWLTANLAADQPLAVVVDDAQWSDAASLEALAHIAHRLEGVPAMLLVASRSEESNEALDALRRQADDGGTLIRLTPLGEEAAAVLIRSVAPSANDALCRACYRAAGGNPFLLHELARSLDADGVPAFAAERVLDQSPERVTREIAARLERVPGAAAALARAAAVLGEDAPLHQAAALAGIDRREAANGADALIVAGILRSAQPLEFLHPLIRSAVYDGIAPAARSLDHGRAARQLAEAGAAPERVAAQLLRCQPAGDGWACEQLLAAAQLAAGGGAAEAAARYLRRALEEPPPAESRPLILLQLGVTEAMASDPDAAIDHLREALAADLNAETRAHATILLSALLGHRYRSAEAGDVIDEQIALLADRPDLHARAEASLINVTRIDPITRGRATAAAKRLRERVAAGGVTDPAVLGTIATEMVMAGDPADQAADLAERALETFDWVNMGPDWSGYIAARGLVMAERYDRAREVLDHALELARERGSVIDVGGGLAFRAELLLRVGDLAGAEVDARTLLEFADAAGWEGGVGFGAAFLGEVLVARGELDDAEELMVGEKATAAMVRGYTAAEFLLARGRLYRARGRLKEAVDSLRECGRWSTATEVLNPGCQPWRSELAHVLLDLGQTEEAGRLAAEELERARRFGAPRAMAVALRAAARLESGMDSVRILREAIDVLADSPAQLERARVHAALGSALRHAGAPPAEVREPLREAVDLAHRCGAAAVEDEALEELRATGARPRRRVTTGANALTPSERRIAELAAGGQQNREIAQALFVTTHTVEFHLRNAYRKLGIKGRSQLEDALGRRAG